MPLKRSEISYPIELFYDGGCPICMKEIRWLDRQNVHHRLKLIDIRMDDFTNTYPEFDLADLDRVIHARLGDGKVVTGVDATLASWEAIGKGFWIAPLRWPLIRSVADMAYRVFANNRHALARRLGFLLGNPVCKINNQR